jgi:hypothetical protein
VHALEQRPGLVIRQQIADADERLAAFDDHRVAQRQLEREGIERDLAQPQVAMLFLHVRRGLRTDEPRHAPEPERRIRRKGEHQQRRHQDERRQQHFAECGHALESRTGGYATVMGW